MGRPTGAFTRRENDLRAIEDIARTSTPPAGTLDGAAVRWGADYLHDETAQPLSDGRFFVPPMDQHSVGPFAQLELPVTDRLMLEGGVRHEQIWLDVDDFTTIEEVGGASVRGGDLSYDATVFNAGVIFGLTDELEAFGSFSQGSSVSEMGRELRTTSAPSVEALSPVPKETDAFELGVRGHWRRLHFAISGYLNESDLGSSYGPDFRDRPRAGHAQRQREEPLRRVLPADHRPGGQLRAGLRGRRRPPDLGRGPHLLVRTSATARAPGPRPVPPAPGPGGP